MLWWWWQSTYRATLHKQQGQQRRTSGVSISLPVSGSKWSAFQLKLNDIRISPHSPLPHYYTQYDGVVHPVSNIEVTKVMFNPLKPNDTYRGRTAPLTSKRCILHIYSTNIGTEYFKNGIYSPLFPLQKCSLFHNSNVFGSCIIHILCTGCAKIKKKTIPAPKG